MQKFIDKVKLQNLQDDNSANKIFLSKKIHFNNILKKKKVEEDKAEYTKLLKVVKEYYYTQLKRKALFTILTEYYKIQSLLCVFKFSDIRRKWKLVFLSFLKNKCTRKLTNCVTRSISIFTLASRRTNLKFRSFKILQNEFLNTKRVYLKIKKKRINNVIMNIFSAWLSLSTKSINNKFIRAYNYYILRKKKRIFQLWKRMIQDEKFFKNIDMIFLKLETIASSWRKK
ncbi:conserved Plasmodium protein, unknown function [Plasmodium malariae]|uniref:Uncharacterized protein n=1 Tax=Plasmodium malariae TaxID=5858 RepID=A0A1D3SQF7_PLAMA|nr:conserved Plasmodium protein, unknown function [Plasmodium malariae]SCO94132.1 conserved Plasmodium protein, unknown function [Plasmodium malariae]